jgi:hypothetical protein
MSNLAVVETGRIVAWLVFGLAALAVDAVVAWRLVRTPPERFRFRGWAKAGWLIAIFGITWHLGLIEFPVGALLALSRIWTPPAPPDSGSVPFAEGDGWPEGWA